MMPALAVLAAAIEEVRHRGLQKRVDRRKPEIPMRVVTDGIDWDDCAVCVKESELILAALARRGFTIGPEL